MNSLTLKYGSDERLLSAWGISFPRLELVSRAPSRMIFPVPGADPTTADPASGAAFEIPYQGLCTVYMDRTVSGGGFSGGEIIFQGRRSDIQGVADPQHPGLNFVLSDPWWDLEQLIFQHYWQAVASISGGVPTYSTQYFSQLNLFQDISAGPSAPWTTLTTDQQIAQIITFAAGSGANVQLGVCDPAWNLPVYPVKSITCAAALLHCLSLVPDAVTFFDYTTSPPKLHIRQRPNCTAATLPFADGTTHKSSRLRPLPNLQPSQVVLQYRKQFNNAGTLSTQFFVDAYPVGGDGRALGAIVAAIDLRGGILTNVYGTVNSAAIDPTTAAFWQKYKPDLADASVSSLTVLSDAGHPLKVRDDATGSDITGTWAANWPNAIDPAGTTGVASWMQNGGTPIVAKEVTITAWVSYSRSNTLGDSTHGSASLALHMPKDHQVSVRLRLTNSPAGAQNYSAVQKYDPGETPPGYNATLGNFSTSSLTNNGQGGLAYLIYQSLATLQYEGAHITVGNSISQVTQNDIASPDHTIICPGNVLNLSGGPSDWAAMNAVITKVIVDFFHGTTEITIGPEKHLGPAELAEKILMWRYRLVFDDPNIRNTGKASSTANSVPLPTDAPKENTAEGVPAQSLHTVIGAQDGSGNQALIQLNATTSTIGGIAGPAVVLGYVDNTGASLQDASHGRVAIKLSDTADGAGTQHALQLREIQFTDGSGATKYAIILTTAEFTDSSPVAAYTIAGGGATVAPYAIHAIAGDYLTCYKVTGWTDPETPTMDTSATFTVARPVNLRNSVSKIEVGGVETDYSYGGDFVTRTAAVSGGATYSEVITPPYQGYGAPTPGPCVIWAATVPSSPGTGVTAASTLLDINVDARCWAISQPSA